MILKPGIRLAFAAVTVFCVAAALCGALAQATALWDGYAVLAQDSENGLHAAVVQNAETGGRTLLLAETRNGAFTITGRGGHTVPETWADSDLSVEVHTAQDALDKTWVIVRSAQEDPLHTPFVCFRLQNGGWRLQSMQCQRKDTWYDLYHNSSGLFASIETETMRRGAYLSLSNSDLASFSYTDAMNTADACVAERLQWEAETAQTQRQEALAGTPWENAVLLTRRNYPAYSDFIVTITVLQTDTETGLCILSKTESGTWKADINPRVLPFGTGAGDLEISFPHFDNPEDNASLFTLSLFRESGRPEITFRRDAQGVWQTRSFTFLSGDSEHWITSFADGIIRLYPGHYLEEQSYLEFPANSAAITFSAFNPPQMKALLTQHYADFMAGEPPVIPDDGSAFALPQPCGAALQKGTYAVYSGPGKQYYREDDGAAAVSADDWVQVFGTDGDWTLIQYRVKDALLRFGYIQTSALQDPDAAPPLVLESVPLEKPDNEFVTSNPLGMGGRLYFPHRGIPMTRLGTLGDIWMYVELTMPNGQPARMFAEVEPSYG